MNNRALETYLNDLLSVHCYNDYAPNGLQIEGVSEIKTLVCGVSASLELIELAIKKNADALIVHHGYFWKNDDRCITGIRQKRIKTLLEKNINLYAYHLPLDGHDILGNNAQLSKLWKISEAKPIAPFELIWTGKLPDISANDFAKTITTTLNRQPLLISAGNHKITKIAWCSGGAQGFLEQVAKIGVDAYVSGEVSEKTYHETREYGIHYFAAGHHATERGGVMAIADYLNQNSDINCQFIDCYNPV